jgi:hypothetical protein
MNIQEIIQILKQVSGLDDNQAKTAVYYALATHYLSNFDWFPVLDFVGAPGTGKSKAIDVLSQIVYKPHRTSCHATMTPAALRDELVKATDGTAIIEEGDLYPNRKQFQNYIINRVDKIRSSGIVIKEQTEVNGVKKWATKTYKVFGATIIHDRHLPDDLAAESRMIVIQTVLKPGNFIDPPMNLTLPVIQLGEVPDYFNSGRVLDTWKPLIRVAAGVGDTDWMIWAWDQIEAGIKELKDGQVYEDKLTIFCKVIEFYSRSGILSVTGPLTLDYLITEPLKKSSMPQITPHLVKKTLTKLGFTVKRVGGMNKLFTSNEEIKKIAQVLSYEDEVLV